MDLSDVGSSLSQGESVINTNSSSCCKFEKISETYVCLYVCLCVCVCVCVCVTYLGHCSW